MALPLPSGRLSLSIILHGIIWREWQAMCPPSDSVAFTAYILFILIWEPKSFFKLKGITIFFKPDLIVAEGNKFPQTLRRLLIYFFPIMSTHQGPLPMLFPRNNSQICFIFLLSHPPVTHAISTHMPSAESSHMTLPKWREPGKCSPHLGFSVTVLHHGRE